MTNATSGVNSTYSPVMKPALAVAVKRMPSLCSQKTTTSTRPSQMPSSTPRRAMGMPLARRMANISRPARGKRMLICAPTERPPSSTMRVMGKPKPHTVATEAMMSTAVRWEMAGLLVLIARSGDAQEYEDSTIQPHDVLVTQTSDPCADL